VAKRWCTSKPIPTKGPWHQCSWYHYEMVNSYRAYRESMVQRREKVTGGYPTEMREYGPIVTFKTWLQHYHYAEPED
jgi:hypothetical protein